MLLRSKRANKTAHVETVLLHLFCDVRSTRLVTIDRESKITSVHCSVANLLTFIIVAYFCLTNTRDIYSITVGKITDPVNVLSALQFVKKWLFNLLGLEGRTNKVFIIRIAKTSHIIY
jgi:hypothetical protein